MHSGRNIPLWAVMLFFIMPSVRHQGEFAKCDGPPNNNAADPAPSPAAPGAETGLDNTTSKPARMRDDIRLQRWWFTMGWGLVLIVVFLAGAGAIVVFSRRFRDYLKPNASSPTPNEDVWAMHVDPPTDEDAFGEFEIGDDENDDEGGFKEP